MADTKCKGVNCKDCPECIKSEMDSLKKEIAELRKETSRLKELCGKLRLMTTIGVNRWRYGLLIALVVLALFSTLADIFFQFR